MGAKKRGRPKLENPRTKKLLLRFTEEEYEHLTELLASSITYRTRASLIRAMIENMYNKSKALSAYAQEEITADDLISTHDKDMDILLKLNEAYEECSMELRKYKEKVNNGC